MNIILLLILVPLLLVLIFVIALVFATYAKLRQLWYKITGREPQRGAFEEFFRQQSQAAGGQGAYRSSRDYAGNSGASDRNSYRSTANTSGNGGSQKKIFSKDEGEYVDFEVVE